MITLFEEFEHKKDSYTLYHSTNSDFFKEPESDRDGMYYNPLGQGLYFSSIKSYSKRFGKNTYVYSLPKNSNILFIDKSNYQEYMTDILKELVSRWYLDEDMIDWDDVVMNWNDKKDYYHTISDPPIGILNNFMKFFSYEYDIKERDVQDIMEEVVNEFNSKYDVIWYQKDLYKGKEDEIVIPFDKFKSEYFENRLNENVDNEEEDYYHSVPNHIVDNILKEGLRGKKPSSGRLHDEEREKDEDSDEDAPPNKERIYLSYSDWDIMKFGGGYTILSISENAIKNLDVYSDAQWDGIYVTSKDKDEVMIHPKFIKIFKQISEQFINENNSYPTKLYHGTTIGHDFKGVSSVGTFLSTSKGFAIEYMGEWKGVTDGKLYEVIIKANLNLFDTKNINDCTMLVNKFDKLEDKVEDYADDDDSYIIDTPEKLYNLNNTWFAIEKEEGCLKWLEQQYDGIILFEDGIQNILLFKPVKEKIISFKEV